MKRKATVYLRLIHEKEFFPVEQPPQTALQGQSLYDLSVHVLSRN